MRSGWVMCEGRKDDQSTHSPCAEWAGNHQMKEVAAAAAAAALEDTTISRRSVQQIHRGKSGKNK